MAAVLAGAPSGSTSELRLWSGNATDVVVNEQMPRRRGNAVVHLDSPVEQPGTVRAAERALLSEMVPVGDPGPDTNKPVRAVQPLAVWRGVQHGDTSTVGPGARARGA
jgi:hypothetical protein